MIIAISLIIKGIAAALITLGKDLVLSLVFLAPNLMFNRRWVGLVIDGADNSNVWVSPPSLIAPASRIHAAIVLVWYRNKGYPNRTRIKLSRIET